MTGRELLEGMSYVDDRFIEEAERETVTYTPRRQMNRWITFAACLCIVAGSALGLYRMFGGVTANSTASADTAAVAGANDLEKAEITAREETNQSSLWRNEGNIEMDAKQENAASDGVVLENLLPGELPGGLTQMASAELRADTSGTAFAYGDTEGTAIVWIYGEYTELTALEGDEITILLGQEVLLCEDAGIYFARFILPTENGNILLTVEASMEQEQLIEIVEAVIEFAQKEEGT